MADPSPLLAPAGWAESPSSPERFNSLDEAIEQHAGGFGPYNILQAVLVSLAWLFDAAQVFISVFTDEGAAWHCTSGEDDVCGTAADPCSLPEGSWEWDRQAGATVVSEWRLACMSPFIAGLPATSFHAGSLAGGFILAPLADSWMGRKRVLVASCLIMSLSGLLTSISPNIWIYSGLRFVAGFGRATVGTCVLVLSTEVVGKKWRGKVGVLGLSLFTVGFLSLPLMAYLGRDSSWRMLYIWTSGPCLVYSFVVHLVVHESPRWLFVRGRRDEAIQTLITFAAFNGSSCDFALLEVTSDEAAERMDMFSAMKILCVKRWALRRLAAVTAVATGTGLVYYAMPLAIESLSFNHYLSVTLNATAELPAVAVAFCLIGLWNRRSAVVGFTLLSGVCSFLCGFVGGGGRRRMWAEMGLELVSFFAGCTALNVLLIYTMELFPTCVRNSALSMVRQAMVLGGACGPVLVAGWRRRKRLLLPFGIFGITVALAGLFALRLPETKGRPMYDTLEDAEQESAGAHHLIRRRPPPLPS